MLRLCACIIGTFAGGVKLGKTLCPQRSEIADDVCMTHLTPDPNAPATADDIRRIVEAAQERERQVRLWRSLVACNPPADELRLLSDLLINDHKQRMGVIQ